MKSLTALASRDSSSSPGMTFPDDSAVSLNQEGSRRLREAGNRVLMGSGDR